MTILYVNTTVYNTIIYCARRLNFNFFSSLLSTTIAYVTISRVRLPGRVTASRLLQDGWHWGCNITEGGIAEIFERGILLFYAVFYSSLACMFAICMKLLLSTLNDHTPHFTLTSSIIGTNPGLGFRPMSPDVEDGSLIYYEAGNSTNVGAWTSRLDKFLAVYKNKTLLQDKGINQQRCGYNMPPQKDKVCEVTLANMGPCSSEQNYQYPKAQPCVFIKLNKIFDWEPEFYNNHTDIPSDMPSELKTKILSVPKYELNTIWVTCDGEAPADKDNIGPLKLYPQDGFPGYYYPYRNKQDYLSPLIAIHFLNPKRHTLINVECRAWAKNIFYKRSLQNREGSVHFELMID